MLDRFFSFLTDELFIGGLGLIAMAFGIIALIALIAELNCEKSVTDGNKDEESEFMKNYIITLHEPLLLYPDIQIADFLLKGDDRDGEE